MSFFKPKYSKFCEINYKKKEKKLKKLFKSEKKCNFAT